MKKKEMATLAGGIRRLCDDLTFIADVLEGTDQTEHAGSEASASPPIPEPDVTDTGQEEAPAPPKYTFEQVRGILVEKARTGHREQVKALVGKYGKEQLSDYKEMPDILEALVKDVEGL